MAYHQIYNTSIVKMELLVLTMMHMPEFLLKYLVYDEELPKSTQSLENFWKAWFPLHPHTQIHNYYDWRGYFATFMASSLGSTQFNFAT